MEVVMDDLERRPVGRDDPAAGRVPVRPRIADPGAAVGGHAAAATAAAAAASARCAGALEPFRSRLVDVRRGVGHQRCVELGRCDNPVLEDRPGFAKGWARFRLG